MASKAGSIPRASDDMAYAIDLNTGSTQEEGGVSSIALAQFKAKIRSFDLQEGGVYTFAEGSDLQDRKVEVRQLSFFEKALWFFSKDLFYRFEAVGFERLKPNIEAKLVENREKLFNELASHAASLLYSANSVDRQSKKIQPLLKSLENMESFLTDKGDAAVLAAKITDLKKILQNPKSFDPQNKEVMIGTQKLHDLLAPDSFLGGLTSAKALMDHKIIAKNKYAIKTELGGEFDKVKAKFDNPKEGVRYFLAEAEKSNNIETRFKALFFAKALLDELKLPKKDPLLQAFVAIISNEYVTFDHKSDALQQEMGDMHLEVLKIVDPKLYKERSAAIDPLNEEESRDFKPKGGGVKHGDAGDL